MFAFVTNSQGLETEHNIIVLLAYITFRWKHFWFVGGCPLGGNTQWFRYGATYIEVGKKACRQGTPSSYDPEVPCPLTFLLENISQPCLLD